MRFFAHRRDRSRALWLNWLLAVSMVLLTGALYRNQAARLKFIVQNPVKLPVALKFFPSTIEDWAGRDVPIPEHIRHVADNDDFINRLYVNESTNQWANIYVAYTGRPRTMVGHRPAVCYAAGGWVHDNSEQSQFLSSAGRQIQCLIHRFHKPVPSHEETVVLNFYILNGQLTCSESGFSGIGWRTPNIAGDHARYVAQVQISSVLENSVRTAARDFAELILEFFPDSNGTVKAMQYIDGAGVDPKL